MLIYEKNHSGNELCRKIYAKDLTYHAHLHHSFEFVFCLEGEIAVTVGGIPYLLQKNQGALAPSNVIHSYKTENTSELYVLQAGKNLLRDVSDLFLQQQPERYTFTIDPALRQLILEYFVAPDRTVFGAKAILYRTFDIFLHNNAFSPSESTDSDVAVRLLEYIQDHFQDPITLKTAAQHIDYDYFYVSKLLHKTLGTSFTELLCECRIAYAKELLSSREYSISQIALLSGFGSIRSFNRVFQQFTGTTPSRFAAACQVIPTVP